MIEHLEKHQEIGVKAVPVDSSGIHQQHLQYHHHHTAKDFLKKMTSSGIHVSYKVTIIIITITNIIIILIIGVPYKMTEEDIRESLEAAMSDGEGSIAEIRLVRDKETGSSRGFGYVDFVNKDLAAMAQKELNGMLLGGYYYHYF